KTNKADPNFSALFKNAQGHLSRIASTKGYEDIMLISADGKIELTCDAHLAEVELDVSSEPCFKEGKEKTHFTGLFYNKFAGKNLMWITTPCFDMQGRFAGCVILEMGMKRIYNLLVDREGLGETGESYLIDREKFMISESRFIKDAVLRVKVDTVGVNEGLNGKTGVAVYPDYRNTPVFGSWHPIKYTNWVLLVEKDEAEAFAPLWANQINYIILLSVTVIMVVVIAVFSARATVKPVQELIAVSEYVREGKLDRDVIIQSHDEIGLLINVFNKLIRDMRLLAEQAMVISRGDLTVHIETKGDLAGAFTNMLESLRTLIKQTQESITRLSSVSMEMLSSTEEQASGSAELAASVGEITATVEELSSSAKQVAVNAESVAKIAGDSELTGNQGRESISESIHIMEEIKETTKDSMKKVASFSEKSQKIGDVLSMIREIASETHLLALNASIEASSAGEFGK
ncbi:MAG: methyl-accepting chemotaxis protein, partial [Planctomycetota bacterium]